MNEKQICAGNIGDITFMCTPAMLPMMNHGNEWNCIIGLLVLRFTTCILVYYTIARMSSFSGHCVNDAWAGVLLHWSVGQVS